MSKKTLDKTKFVIYNIEDIKKGDIIANPRDRCKRERVKIKKIHFFGTEQLYCIEARALNHLRNEDGYRQFYANSGDEIRKYTG